jgi:cytoskeletal protein CcmA (bactofilin family)
MGRDRGRGSPEPSETISIVGPGMTFVGDCETDGTIRVEGRLEGSIRAGRSVMVGPGGVVTGDVHARDATVAGTVNGTVVAESKLDLQETSRLDGEVFARTVRVGEGAVLNGAVHMGEDAVAKSGRGKAGDRPPLHLTEPVAATA